MELNSLHPQPSFDTINRLFLETMTCSLGLFCLLKYLMLVLCSASCRNLTCAQLVTWFSFHLCSYPWSHRVTNAVPSPALLCSDISLSPLFALHIMLSFLSVFRIWDGWLKSTWFLPTPVTQCALCLCACLSSLSFTPPLYTPCPWGITVRYVLISYLNFNFPSVLTLVWFRSDLIPLTEMKYTLLFACVLLATVALATAESDGPIYMTSTIMQFDSRNKNSTGSKTYVFALSKVWWLSLILFDSSSFTLHATSPTSNQLLLPSLLLSCLLIAAVFPSSNINYSRVYFAIISTYYSLLHILIILSL